MTELEALQICRELWYWIYLNPERNKCEWPGWKKYGRMTSSCPCCEYRDLKVADVGVSVRNSCDLCPLLGYAWQAKGALYCIDNPESFFWKYRLTPRRQAAGMIVACDEAIRNLRNEAIRNLRKRGWR